MPLNWDTRDGQHIVSLRNAKGSGNPIGRPYRLFAVDMQRRPVFSHWLSMSDLALLHNQLSQELRLRPITDVLRGATPNDRKAGEDHGK